MKRNEIISEISLGDYRKKAGMQKAQSQMGAMFAKDPEERKKNLATFNKREKGLNRLKGRDEKARKAAADKDMSDAIAQLPQLKDEYEQMRAKYKSLGGSNWQYADREQNLTDREREARSMEGPMNNLWRKINAAEKAQKSESMAEADELRARGGLAAVNKKPRTGQTDMRDIPVGNHPDARINKFTDKDRSEHPSRLKAKIKSTLGKHTRPNLPEQGVAEGSGANKTDLAMAYLMAVVNAPIGTSEKRRISNWQQILDYKFDIEMDTATLAQMLPQLDSQLQAGKLDKLQNRMISRGELSIESIQQGVAEGLEEGRSDYVGDAIEGLRMAKPGLEKEDFLDELYIYIDAEMGMEAAERAFADKDAYDDWYESYADSVDENANMLKVAKDDDKQTILQNPSTGVQTQIDKTNPNAPSLTKDETTGKLKLAAPAQGGASAVKPNLVGKDVEVATESSDLAAMLRIAGLR